MKIFLKRAFTILIILTLIGCKKDWLNQKPQDSLSIPATLKEFQALLDNTSIVGKAASRYRELTSDDYSTSYTTWSNLPADVKGFYVWDYKAATSILDYTDAYKQVFYANIVLDGLESPDYNDVKNGILYDNIKGTALFTRGRTFFNLLQEFAKPYNSKTADSDLGIPLKITADLNETIFRSTVKQCYEKVVNDLLEASVLLPDAQNFKYRPVKAAAYAFLARVYLSMQDYTNAGVFASKSLAINSALLDYNTLNASDAFPITAYQSNPEVLYNEVFTGITPYLQVNLIVPQEILQSYQSNDLRSSIFFKPQNGVMTFKGSYAKSGNGQFSGPTTAEMLLTRAEVSARAGDVQKSMDDINLLLKARYNKNILFVPLTAAGKDDALAKVLKERRKELIYRSLRWIDLRRLNLEGANITVSRNLNGQIFSLLPNDSHYVFPIPDDVIRISGITQNP